MSEWMYWEESDWNEGPSGNGKELTETADGCLPDDLDFCTLLSGSSQSSSFAFSPANSDHTIVGEGNNVSGQTEKPKLVFTVSVDPKGNDHHIDESVNVKVTVDLQQDTSSHSDVLSHSLPADALVWSPALRPLDRLLATNIEMARLQQELEDVELSGENDEKVKRPRNAFMFFCSNQRPQLQKHAVSSFLCCLPALSPFCRLYPGLNNRTISQMLGAMWRSLSSEEKEPFQGEAAREREHHKKQHPDWKYSVDRAKGVKRRMKAVRKLQRVFEREMKGKGGQIPQSHDQATRPELSKPEDFVPLTKWNPDADLWCFEASNTCAVSSDTHEPAACWVTSPNTTTNKEKDKNTVTLSTALDMLDYHSNDSYPNGSPVPNETCDDQTAPTLSSVSDATQIVHEQNLSMFGSSDQQLDGSLSTVSEVLPLEMPLSSFHCAFHPMPKRNKKKVLNPYSFGCRRFYGITCFDMWCSGCRQKKRCCRNDQFSISL